MYLIIILILANFKFNCRSVNFVKFLKIINCGFILLNTYYFVNMLNTFYDDVIINNFNALFKSQYFFNF